ncbi:FAD-dependent oxidoreductase [Mucilaginibacter segetis]|uniref:Flavin-dependent monooxygenase n=1 Tax=Mucilaginibacter segetis TaxID=2793071 RepID=A0A934UMF7_9SPHI|nr:NAD(P)/FAD-dependent oxidoreductase [Mucilaginibacter segetis]MBK0378985.1 FAD-dependent monooxygenase [Mucilaginibacter segetis]
MMNNIENKTIAIIGGGPGGLTLARLLQMKGAKVTVYERDAHKDARPKGATLDLHEESGLLALQEAGLMDAFNASYRPGADMLRIIDKHGTILLDDAENPRLETIRPEIDRGPLQNLLLDSLTPGTVIWDSQFVSISPMNEGWRIEFKNGKKVFSDIVIAADGANSRLRPYLTDIKPFYAGVTGIEGYVNDSASAIPKMHKLLNGGKIFAMGDEKTLIVSSKGDGSLVFYTGCKTDEFWSKTAGIDFTKKAEVLAWFKQEYAGWEDIWLDLFENASGNFIPRPIYSMPIDQTWKSKGNITLLGDAAHLMPPYAGEGVNMAMLDALELSKNLTSQDHPDLISAIESYETQMRSRASEAADMSLKSTELLHSSNAISFMMSVVGYGNH